MFLNKDGNKLNNDLLNLEWVTHLENMIHAVNTGLMNNKGENNGMSKLKYSDIPLIKKLLNNGISQYKISKQYS